MHTVALSRLPNGLRVVTIHRPHLHRAVVSAYIRVGSRHETPGSNGLSHFLEHMLFRGTARHPSAADFNHAIESFGGTLGAATHGDFTRFDLTLPPDAVAEGCGALGEVFTRPVFSASDVEKGIVREEILEDLDEDGHDINADNLCRALVFGAHPLGYPITGSVSNVERFSERHLRAWLGRHYVARNMVVAVAGPVGHRPALRAVERGFSGLSSGTACATRAFQGRQGRARVRSVRNAGSQTSVRVAFPTPGQRTRTARALELFMRVLDDGMSTRLHRRICDERGLAYEVNAGLELFDDSGVLDVASSVAPSSLPALVSEVLAILSELALEGPTRAEVDKAHRRFTFDLDALEDDAHALADFYGAAELFHLRQTPAERRREVLSFTADDVRRAARSVIDPARTNLTVVGPDERAAKREVTALLRRFRARMSDGRSAQALPRAHEPAQGPRGAPPVEAPAPSEAARRAARVPRRPATLDLGAPLS